MSLNKGFPSITFNTLFFGTCKNVLIESLFL